LACFIKESNQPIVIFSLEKGREDNSHTHTAMHIIVVNLSKTENIQGSEITYHFNKYFKVHFQITIPGKLLLIKY